MRVCIYTETALPIIGGQELGIDALARQFLAQGHEVVVLTLRARRRQTVDDGELPYPVVRHRRYLSTRHLLEIYRSSLSSVYQEYPFDILHCHNVYPAGYVAAGWAASRGVPLVLTSHACDIAPDSHLLRKPGVPQRISKVLKQANAVVAISAPVEEQFRRLGLTDCRVARIPNGVDVERLSTLVDRPAGMPVELIARKYYLFLGRLVERKGADLLLEALHLMACSNDAAIAIAGSGEHAELLKLKAARLGLANRIHFLGDASGQLKSYLLQNAICTVMPSRRSEGSSLVLLESFAAGRPVIGTAIPGLSNAIRPGETGWLVAEESPTELAAAMCAAADDMKRTDEMGKTGRSVAREFDWRSIAEQHLALYEGLLSNHSRRVAA
ncbi:MAG: glycosyltransferase family 4 protein [Planctomycetia bacterium]|nr:glycosyltransferase family 4 protein [Planctomycetia bacterium]